MGSRTRWSYRYPDRWKPLCTAMAADKHARSEVFPTCDVSSFGPQKSCSPNHFLKVGLKLSFTGGIRLAMMALRGGDI